MKFAYLIEPPFNFIDTTGRVTGCDVELARHIFREMNITSFETEETQFSDLLPGLADGRWHMTTGLFGTEERRKKALFSRPIWALSDGLLVAKGNPLNLIGYTSVAKNTHARLAVIRDQLQHRTAIDFGIEDRQIVIFDTYLQAASAVQTGEVDVYASVGRAHSGFVQRHPDWAVTNIPVPSEESRPAFGSFAFNLNDGKLVHDVNNILADFLGSVAHRQMVAAFGFSDPEIDLVTTFTS